jgi:hypothetical protein
MFAKFETPYLITGKNDIQGKKSFLTLSEDAGWIDISCYQGHIL